MARMIVILDVPDLDPIINDPHDPVDEILSVYDDDVRAGNATYRPELIGAEWIDSPAADAMLHLASMRGKA